MTKQELENALYRLRDDDAKNLQTCVAGALFGCLGTNSACGMTCHAYPTHDEHMEPTPCPVPDEGHRVLEELYRNGDIAHIAQYLVGDVSE